jgi:type IV pilus assembly protein PilA
MINLHRAKGFTLIELIIVMAIIAVLVAIALPQYSAYRTRSFNAAAVSDLKNFVTMMESSYSENQKYPTY